MSRPAKASNPRPARSRATNDVESPWNDPIGIAFLMLAALYFLALLSYDPQDNPAWSNLSTSDQPNEITHNFVGRLGSVFAAYSFYLMGVATYLIPISLTWFGVCLITANKKVTGRSWIGVAVMVASAAAIFSIDNLFNSQDHITPMGGGGGLGRVLGEMFLMNLLGKVGSTMLLAMAYGFGLFLVARVHPLLLIQELRREIPNWLDQWKLRTALAGGINDISIVTPDGTPADQPLRRRRVAKTASPDQSAPEVSPPLVNAELGLRFDPPAPKIIDSSGPRPHVENNKPRLAEVWEKKRAQKLEQDPPVQLSSLAALFKDYKLPSLELLNWVEDDDRAPTDKGELLGIQNTIVRTLASFGIQVEPGDITRGPSITRYEVRPSDGLRVSRIANLDADLARATRAERINILAPIPGKDTVGIELANKERVVVPIRELLEDEVFQNGKARIPVALGKDVYGKTIIGDLAAMPHLLVAGATGSGKSVCINGIITSLLCRFAPDELRFVMIDPKVVEMQNYADLPHLALPVVTDPKKALLALRWVVKEMEGRYQMFAQEGCRNFEVFNNRNRKKDPAAAAKNGPRPGATPEIAPDIAPDNLMGVLEDEMPIQSTEPEWTGDAAPPPKKAPEQKIPDTLPYMVVIVDELADLMQTASADIEVAIARITQMARAAGIHLIVATQTPRADVITGVIKANIPTRIAFQVASALDSRVILDRKGAENLVGKGDMLYVPPGGSQPIRSQGALVTDEEIHDVVECCVLQGKPVFDAKVEDGGDVLDEMFGDDNEGGISDEEESILDKCIEVIRQEQKASTSLLQRRLRLGYGRAARMIDILEDRGIIGPGDGAKPREILVNLDEEF